MQHLTSRNSKKRTTWIAEDVNFAGDRLYFAYVLEDRHRRALGAFRTREAAESFLSLTEEWEP
jgi:hypothetical protein